MQVYAEVCAGPLEMQFDVIEHIITRLQKERVDVNDDMSIYLSYLFVHYFVDNRRIKLELRGH